MAKITLRGKPINTSGELPKVGGRAPDFKLVDSGLKDVSLSDFKGKKKLLNIFPSLDTPTCALSRFCTAENTKNVVTLSLMRGRDFAKDYGVLIQDGPLAGITARAVVVLDANDKVVYTQLVPEIVQEPDYEKALAALK